MKWQIPKTQLVLTVIILMLTPLLCVSLCLHPPVPSPLSLFPALSALHQVISSFAIAMATKRCACLTAVHYVSEQRERERERETHKETERESERQRDVVERRIKAARSLRRRARMKPTASVFLLQTIVDPLCMCVCVCVCETERCVEICCCVCLFCISCDSLGPKFTSKVSTNRDSLCVQKYMDTLTHILFFFTSVFPGLVFLFLLKGNFNAIAYNNSSGSIYPSIHFLLPIRRGLGLPILISEGAAALQWAPSRRLHPL